MNEITKTSAFTSSRRAFLQGSAAALVVSFTLGSGTRRAEAGTGTSISAYVEIAADDTVTLYVGATEMGQGILTGLAHVMAEELKLNPANWSKIRVEHGVVTPYTVAGSIETAPYSKPSGYKSQSTGGSTSMKSWFTPMRQAAAATLSAIVDAYTKLPNNGGPSVGSCTVSNGTVSGGLLGVKTFGEIVSQTASFVVPDPSTWASLPLTNAADYKFIGKDKAGTGLVPFPRVDVADKVNGNAKYGIDVTSDTDPALAGLKYAVVVHAPTLGSTVSSFTTPSGAKVVKLWNHSLVGSLANGFYDPTTIVYNAIAVVDTSATSNTWWANRLASSAKPVWKTSTFGTTADTTAIFNKGAQLIAAPDSATVASLGSAIQKIKEVGSPESVTKLASIDAVYQLPFLAHTPMEPPSATVVVTGSNPSNYVCKIWASTQSQTACVDTAQKVLAFGQTTVVPSAIPVTLTTMMLGGGLGRKLETDYISQAVQIAKAMPGVPVKLTWLRPEDLKNDRYRPGAQIRVQLGLDTSGSLAMIYRNVSPSVKRYKGTAYSSADVKSMDTGAVAGASGIVYACPALRIEYLDNPENIPIGYWRSVGESYNTFAIESAIDELWLAAKNAGVTIGGIAVANDPLNFRLSLVKSDARATAVISRLKSDLALAGNAPPQTGRGYAFMYGFGSYVAMATEIAIDAITLKPIVKRIFTVVDCGTAVNPDAVRGQVEGGIIHGLSAALWGQITAVSGKVAQSNFNNYRVMKLKEIPVFKTSILNSGAAIGGVGELPVPVVAPSIANAYALMTGNRTLARTLPWTPGATMGGL